MSFVFYVFGVINNCIIEIYYRWHNIDLYSMDDPQTSVEAWQT